MLLGVIDQGTRRTRTMLKNLLLLSSATNMLLGGLGSGLLGTLNAILLGMLIKLLPPPKSLPPKTKASAQRQPLSQPVVATVARGSSQTLCLPPPQILLLRAQPRRSSRRRQARMLHRRLSRTRTLRHRRCHPRMLQ